MSPNTDAHDDRDDADCEGEPRQRGTPHEHRAGNGDRQRRRGDDCAEKNQRQGTGNRGGQRGKDNCNGEGRRRDDREGQRGKDNNGGQRRKGNCNGEGNRRQGRDNGGGSVQERRGKGDATGSNRGGQGCREGEGRQRRRRRGRERDENGRFADSVTGEDVLAVFEAVDGPVVTSTDVADVLGITTESARQHLNELVGEGPLRRRKTGRTIVYWGAESHADGDP